MLKGVASDWRQGYNGEAKGMDGAGKRPVEEGPGGGTCKWAAHTGCPLRCAKQGRACVGADPSLCLHAEALRTWNWTRRPLRSDLPLASCSSCCAGWISPKSSSRIWVGRSPSLISMSPVKTHRGTGAPISPNWYLRSISYGPDSALDDGDG